MRLPREEALAVLRELVATILRKEDRPIDARFDPEERVTITSTRQYHLFELLDALRSLDPAFADSLFETQAELAAAAAFFPFGMRSVNEAWAKRVAPAGTSGNAARLSVGFGTRMPFANAMMDGQSFGQFAVAFDEAMKLYQRDVHSNASVRECWPSTQAFRSVLYAVGQSDSPHGSAYLEQIPDTGFECTRKLSSRPHLRVCQLIWDTAFRCGDRLIRQIESASRSVRGALYYLLR